MTDRPPPPSYEAVAAFNQRQQNNNDRPPQDIPLTHYQTAPPYRACHFFASSEEELAALQEFAKNKMYITPGTEGTLGGELGLPIMIGRGHQVGVDSEQLKRERIEMLESRKREKQAKKRQKEEAKRVAKENERPREVDRDVAPERKMSVGDRVGNKLKKALSRGNSGSNQHQVIR
ncbi:hypothetical protein DV736_g5162, partial [Chaetothyriales sp. CBS 134916]